MKYKMTEKEKEFLQNIIIGIKYMSSDIPIDLTCTILSPYNLKEMLYLNGYTLTCNDCNEYDYWWEFSHPNVDTVTMFFNAESFELTLEVRKNA